MSFAITMHGPPGARVAADRLAAAVAGNDHGGFWNQRRGSLGPTGLPGEILAALTDGIVLTVLAIIGLLLHLRRVLRPLPGKVSWLLLGIVVLGTVLRATIAVPVIMNAWPYTRVVPAVRLMAEGPVLRAVLHLTGTRIGVFDAIFDFNFLVACLTPAAIFAHARYVLGDWRSALAAAALMAVLPLHIRFSRSDTELALALGLSSLSFLALYASMRAERPIERWVARPILLALGLATYLVRSEAVALVAVDLGAIVLTAGVGVPLRRRLGAASIVITAATALFLLQGRQILERFNRMSEGNPLLIGMTSIVDPSLNPMIDPWITPPLVMVLACAGLWWLWRTDARAKATYLFCWLVGMYCVYFPQCFQVMRARYHLSLITPLVLLAAAATPWLLSWRRPWLRYAVVVGVLLSPLLHTDFERDVNYTEMLEFQFVREMAKSVPDGCTVVEYMPAHDTDHPDRRLHGRWEAIGRSLGATGLTQRWAILEAEQWLEHPPEPMPRCAYYYDGLTCRSDRPADAPLAPACARLRAQAKQRIASASLPFRFYDIANTHAIGSSLGAASKRDPQRIPDGEATPVSLFRLR